MEAWEKGHPLPLEASGKAATAHAWVYQTWRLLTATGIQISLVTELPTKGLVVALSGTLSSSLSFSQASSDFFLIDIVADGLPHPAAHIHLVQNRAHAQRLPHAHFTPHWPQPALLPREKSRATRFEKIGFLGNPSNLAPELLEPHWQECLKKDLSLDFEIKPAEQWHDYSQLDAIIAIRNFSRARQLHKPATKLYNAWLAGVPFIGGNDSAYQSDGRPGVDYLVAKSPQQILEHLRTLKEDPNFRFQLIQNGLASGKKFTRTATLEHWKILIQRTLPELALQWQKKATYQRDYYLFTQRLSCWIDKKLR